LFPLIWIELELPGHSEEQAPVVSQIQAHHTNPHTNGHALAHQQDSGRIKLRRPHPGGIQPTMSLFPSLLFCHFPANGESQSRPQKLPGKHEIKNLNSIFTHSLFLN
jgi:hypothetical protein